MKVTVMRPVEIDVNAIRVTVPFDEDDEIAADFPGRKGERITLVLDLDRSAVRDWPAGRRESLHLKVRDEGVYELLAGGPMGDAAIATRSDCYVPRCLPQKYGDYFIADIGPDGVIAGWAPDRMQVVDAFNLDGRSRG
jgi:hypothetical protein